MHKKLTVAVATRDGAVKPAFDGQAQRSVSSANAPLHHLVHGSIFDDAAYPESANPLEPGDLLLLFTDGLYELENASGDYYDAEQLRAAVTRRLAAPTPELLDGLLAELRAFTQQSVFADDVCIVGIDITKVGGPSPTVRHE